MVQVYTKPNCIQCRMTKQLLASKGVTFKEFNLLDYPEKIDEFKAQGFMSAPIIITDTDCWSGFQPTKINDLR